MRQPTPIDDLLSWHSAHMRGERPARHETEPHCGWYEMQKVKNGPRVPVEIWCDREIDENGELARDEVFRADAFGEELDPVKIWTWLSPISKEEFDRLTEYRKQNQHWMNDGTPIDIGKTPTLPRDYTNE